MNNQLSKIIPEVKDIKKHEAKSLVSLLKEINEEYIVLSELIVSTGFTGVEDNFKIRERLNIIVYQIRRAQDLLIKIKSRVKKEDKKE
jgi:hypothetical protein